MSYTGSYTLAQEIHCLNFMANAGFGIIAPSFTQLQQDVSSIITAALNNTTPLGTNPYSIQQLIGSDWQLKWGPWVYSRNATGLNIVADNTMMLVYSASQNALVLAIAGTNLDSFFDWTSEDFDVSTTVAWTSVVGGSNGIETSPYISTGTATGLANLLALPLPDNTGDTMLATLTAFLSEANTPSGLQLIVTGHSLGGALAPAMAMYLKDILDNGNNWDPQNKIASIAAWPTAGPTPGDLDFAGHITWRLAEKYQSYYNSIDAVPHAWQANTLAAIPTLYAPTLPANDITIALAAELEKKAAASGHIYTQALLWNKMDGTFDQTTDDNAVSKITSLISEYPELTAEIQAAEPLLRFVAQVAYQHTTAYSILLNIVDYSLQFSAIKQATVTCPTMDEILMAEVVNIIMKYIESKLPAGQTTTANSATAAN